MMSSDWDQPEERRRHGTAGDRAAERDGALDPVALFGFVLRNSVKIVAIGAALTAIGLVLLNMVAFPYNATAIVLVDPRDEQVTLQQDVLSSIGSDAAILESMVQIMKSDGFLLTVMKQLNISDEAATPEAGQTGELEQLARFKKNLTVARKGATYLVEISYKAGTAEAAARIANSVADSFAENQNGYLNSATQNAARALAQRLVELRRTVNASEKAVADFAAANGILYVDSNNTLEMRQLTELSAQMALARNAAEEARARYQQQIEGGADVVASSEQADEPAQLSFLRQQRTQLVQTLEQQRLTYGPRHPRIAQTRQLIGGIESQIAEEKQLLTRQLKADVDVADSQQRKLEAEIARLSSGVVTTDSAEVQLEALRREAAADREIYEQFLSRNKATGELVELQTDNVRVVSPAIPPLKSSRPATLLVAPILGFLSMVAATAALAAANSEGGPRPGRRAEPAPAFERRRRATPDAAHGEAPVSGKPRDASLLTMWSGGGRRR